MTDIAAPPHPVPLGMPRLSHSQLTSYMVCGEAYRLERRHELGGSISWALVGGKAFHSWTEVYDRGIHVPPSYFVQLLNEGVAADLASSRNSATTEAEIKPTGRASKEWPNKRDRAWWEHHGPIFCQQYIDWLESPTNELMGEGSKFQVEMKVEGNLGGLDVLGFIDRLVVDSAFGKPVVVDLKGLPLDTPLPTPSGWTTMGEVQPGDVVYDADGAVASVTHKSNTKQIGTYRIVFSDGSDMVVDREHIIWAQRGSKGATRAVPVEEIIASPRRANGTPLWRVPINRYLDAPEADLPLDPYVLGAWLGDGSKDRTVITKTAELFTEIEKTGVPLGIEQVDKRSGAIARTLLGARQTLADLDVLGNKHIPMAYLRASRDQRLALLQGLMDTDGTVNIARRRVCFSGCTERLVRDVAELVRSLGMKALVHHVNGHGFGKDVDVWTIEFTPDCIPFRIPAKRDKFIDRCKMPSEGGLAQWRTIKRIEEGPDVETQCIAVDSPTHTYLATELMIPTHNTGKEPGTLLQLATYAVLASEMLGYPIKHGAFYLAEKGELSKIHDLSSFSREYIESLYEQARRGIGAGVFLPNPNAFCTTCPVRQFCGLYGGLPPLDVPLLEDPIA